MSEGNAGPILAENTAFELRSIALALDCTALNRAAVEAAVALAAATGARLKATFIDDECLHSLAAMPFAREVSFSGTSSRSFGSAQAVTAIHQSAETARGTVSVLATRAHVEYAFDVTRGRLLETLNLLSRGAGIVALCSAGARFGRTHSVDLLRSRMAHGTGVLTTPETVHLKGGPIVTVLSPRTDIAAMVRVTERVAAKAKRPHQFVVVSGDAAERGAMHQAVLEAQSTSVEIAFCEVNHLPQLASTLRLRRPGLVIADIDYAHLDDVDSVEAVGEAFAAPLLLMQL